MFLAIIDGMKSFDQTLDTLLKQKSQLADKGERIDEGQKMLAEWEEQYDGIIEIALTQQGKEILKEGDNDQDGFVCFLCGRTAPSMWDDFSLFDPFSTDNDAPLYLEKCSELYFKDSTLHFLSEYYDLGRILFQFGAYIGTKEAGHTPQ